MIKECIPRAQAVIMAGGLGTRLAGVVAGLPKPLVEVAGKPILLRQIESLRASGVTDITIVIGHLGGAIRAALGDGSSLGVSITYIEEDEPLGTAGALYYLKGRARDDFFLVFGDLVLDIDWTRFMAFHKERGGAVTLFGHPNSHPYDSDIVVADSSGKVLRIEPKGEERRDCHNFVNAGLYCVNPVALKSIKAPIKADFEKTLLAEQVAAGATFAYRSTEYVKDAGTPERLEAVAADVKSGVVEARSLKRKQRAVFLDRDGTINELAGFVKTPADFNLIEGAGDAIRMLNASGFLAIVATNQPVVARGECSLEALDEIHKKMETELGLRGAFLDGIYFCPHHPHGGFEGEVAELKFDCGCRKPKPGMLLKAAQDLNIDLSASWMVGDSTADIQAGINAGTRTVLVMTGEAGQDGKCSAKPDYTAPTLLDAVKLILSESQKDCSMEFKDDIREYIALEIETLKKLDADAINEALNLLVETARRRKRVYVFGNGGSSATASHFQNDFAKGASQHSADKFRFQCLNDNVPTLTAIANDICFEEVFRFQLEGVLEPGDVVIAISGSGNSRNVLNAVEYAKACGNKVIGLTGHDGGRLKALSDISLHVPVDSMQVAEDIHMILDHLMMSALCKRQQSKAYNNGGGYRQHLAFWRCVNPPRLASLAPALGGRYAL